MLDELKELKSDRKTLREFGLLVGGILIALGAFLYWRGHSTAGMILPVPGVLLVTAGALFPAVLLYPYRIWMGLALCLGFVMSRILLSVLFFALMTPLALIMRAFGYRFLELEFRSGKETYWEKRSQKDRKTYHNQF